VTPECTHILPTGQKCRGAALHNRNLCRHHAPSSIYSPPRIARRALFTPRAQWRAFGRQLPFLPSAEIPFVIYQLLQSLTSPDPACRHSDLVIGRHLRLLLSRLGYVPFPVPGVEAPAPRPAPRPPAPPQPAAAPASRPVPAPTFSGPQFDNSTLPPDLRSALEAIYQDTTSDTIEALMEALSKTPSAPTPWSTQR